MKVIINIECDTTSEAKELFKTLAGISTDVARLEALKKSVDAAATKYPEFYTEGEPQTDTTVITAEEVKTEVAKRQRASRAKPKDDAPLATGSDPVPYELSDKGTAAILNTMTVLADEGQTESSTPKTIEDVRLLAKALMNKGHNARLQAEMTKLGATRLSEIKDYDEAFNVLTVLTKEVGL